MNSSVHDILYRDYVESYAEERAARAEFIRAIQDVYQNPDAALSNIYRRVTEDGPEKTLAVLTDAPARCGALRGHWLTTDRYTAGGGVRAQEATAAAARLPDLARKLGEAQEAQRTARAAYEDYCREQKLERQEPGEADRRFNGTAKAPARTVQADEPWQRDWWKQMAAERQEDGRAREWEHERDWERGR